MTDIEKALYAIMDGMGSLPVVFKGAMVTNVIIQDSETKRHTKDIDVNWTGRKLSMQELESAIQSSITNAGLRYEIAPFRDYGKNQSAGFYILNNGERIAKMDVDMREYKGSTTTYKVGEIEFKGVSVEQIIGDKISALSGEKAFRRAKDLVDLQAIASTTNFSLNDVRDYMSENDREIGDFLALFDEDKMGHAYDKLTGVENKKPYEDVVAQVMQLTSPFRGGSGDIWVRPHYRRGKPVKGHWRRRRK